MRDFLHHLLFPRESNNHRPKILHHDSLLITICLFLFSASLILSVQRAYPQVLGISSDISTGDLLTFTNQKRQENGLKPLSMNDQLTQAAQAKASHMFANNYWAHIAPDGTTPWYFIKSSGYEYLYAGENLARGFTTASSVVDAWMNSPTHRENLLSANYDDVGFAVQTGTLTGSDTILVVQELGRRYGETQAVAQQPATQTVSPTPVVVAVVTVAPTPTTVPTATPTPVKPTPTPTTQLSEVASVQNNPLVDSRSVTRTIAISLLSIFLVVLVIDAIIIERKQIARVVAHNVDHILFLTIIILIAIIIGRGLIL